MRQFIWIDPDGRINSAFPDSTQLRASWIAGMLLLHNEEQCITVQTSFMQSGTASYSVSYRELDSPIVSRTGTCAGSQVDKVINEALGVLLHRWNEKFLPPVYRGKEGG